MSSIQIYYLKQLFVNRAECYCIQLDKGYARIDTPLTDDVLRHHLLGTKTVGSYQLDGESNVKWLCFDLDPEKLADPRSTAKQILTVLFETEEDENGNHIPRIWRDCVVLEASRFPDPSFHVWILFLIPVKAKVARWLGLRILELASLSPKQVEVFPKQDQVTTDRPFGNFVKLPFGLHQVERKWSRMLDFDTFEPLPLEELENKHGLSFSDSDLEEIMSFETKTDVQSSLTFTMPEKFKPLSSKEEEKDVNFLCKYWKEGSRNKVEMYFLGLCLKKGVSIDSVKRIITEVSDRTHDSEKQSRLELVDYHYKNRLNFPLKGISGIREIIEEFEKDDDKQRP